MGNISSISNRKAPQNDFCGERSQSFDSERERNISNASCRASEMLHLLQHEYSEIENAQTADEQAMNNSQEFCEIVALKSRLVQRIGCIDRLQFNKVDSIVTENLSSGKLDILSRRKDLNESIDVLRERVMNLLEKISSAIEKNVSQALVCAEETLLKLEQLEHEFWDMEKVHKSDEDNLCKCQDIDDYLILKNRLVQQLGDIDKFQFNKIDGIQTATLESCTDKREEVLERRKQLNEYVEMLRARIEQLLSTVSSAILDMSTHTGHSTLEKCISQKKRRKHKSDRIETSLSANERKRKSSNSFDDAITQSPIDIKGVQMPTPVGNSGTSPTTRRMSYPHKRGRRTKE